MLLELVGGGLSTAPQLIFTPLGAEVAIQFTPDCAKRELATARGAIKVTGRFFLADMALFGLLDEVAVSITVS